METKAEKTIFVIASVITIFLLVSTIVLFVNNTGTVTIKDRFSNKEITIPKSYYNEVLKMNKDSEVFQICSFKDNQCVYFQRLP